MLRGKGRAVNAGWGLRNNLGGSAHTRRGVSPLLKQQDFSVAALCSSCLNGRAFLALPTQ